MRLLIVGTLKGQLTTATKIAMDNGASVTHAEAIEQAMAVLRGGKGADLLLVDVAVAVARKLCAELIAAEPLGEITGLVSNCFSHLVSTPHLVVRIHDSLYEAAREKIGRLAAQAGFEGRLVILAEPEIATGDCKIEWADGGVVLERAAIEAKINELVGRYMTSRGDGTTTIRTEP